MNTYELVAILALGLLAAGSVQADCKAGESKSIQIDVSGDDQTPWAFPSKCTVKAGEAFDIDKGSAQGRVYVVVNGAQTPFRDKKGSPVFWFEVKQGKEKYEAYLPGEYKYTVINLHQSAQGQPVLDPIIIIEP